MGYYKILKKNILQKGENSIVPLRMEDRFAIMEWRNEQLYHLRQNKLLTIEDQDRYFNEVVSRLFIQEHPDQLLFSYLENNQCIGYGGLVHINWIDRHAEISFVMNTAREQTEFHKHWVIYLGLIEQVAFDQIGFHKIYTYAFDLRPHLYEALESSGYIKEATLQEHCFYNGDFIDVIIHAKVNLKSRITMRRAVEKDAQLLFQWVNDKAVRENSIHTEPISLQRHISWFMDKLSSSNSIITIFELAGEPLGQVRLDREGNFWLIDYSIDSKFRGRGLGKILLEKIMNQFVGERFLAFVKPENGSSAKTFESLNFTHHGLHRKNGIELIEFIK